MRRLLALAAGAVIGVAGYGAATSQAPAAMASKPARVTATAQSVAIAYARHQLGKPYLWGGVGPDEFDCSGLVMMAYHKARVTIARTTFDQWKTEQHVDHPEPGDLVFFAGSDGTMTDPGHVGIVIGGGKMIQALGTGYPVMISSYTTRTDLVGFTDPVAG